MMSSKRYERQSFGLPKLPPTTQRPDNTRRLDFQIVAAANICNALSNECEQFEGCAGSLCQAPF